MSSPAKTTIAILSTSHDADSRSRLLAKYALEVLRKLEIDTTWLDLRTFTLPFCGTETSWSDPEVDRLRGELRAASHILFAVPIYNYDVNAAAKNVVELMGERVFGGKTVGFLCAAGGKGSYMSILSFANSLMLDFRCWIVPRFVYATGEDFSDTEITNPEVTTRIEGVVGELLGRPVVA